eukprot:308129-Alexandrium_andersonii.AAC.1
MRALRIEASFSAFSTATTFTGSHRSVKACSKSGSSLEASPRALGSGSSPGAACDSPLASALCDPPLASASALQ